MAYLEMLARDYDLWTALDAGHKHEDAEPHDPQISRILQAVLVEIEQAGVFTAVSMSIASALLVRNGVAINPWHLQSYGPAKAQIYPAIAARLLSSNLGMSNLAPVQDYYARLEFAQRLSQTVLGLDASVPAASRLNEIEKLEDSWRYVCRASMNASAVIRSCLAELGVDAPPVANRAAASLLSAAERGDRPCIDATGNVTVPGWAENRRSKRVTVSRQATTYYRGAKQAVIVDNASTTGIGLKGLEGGITGRMISIVLDSGENLSGMIMWCRGTAAGIKLDEQLSEDHPILQALMN
jgi:hypothetical protein